MEGPYEWKGALIYSGYNKRNIDGTDVLDYVTEDYAKSHYISPMKEYNFELYPNAIDPSVFYDGDGRMWMVYGSWSGGIFLLEIDEETGLVIHPEEDAENNVDPYYGKRLLGSGHNSAMVDDDGKRYIVFHTRFDDGQEYHEPRVHQFLLNEEGWPCMLPYATMGETAEETGYDIKTLAGEYYVINQGTGINAKIAEPVKLVLSKRGNVYGDGITGTWEQKEGTNYLHITYGEKSYSGVFCTMEDEAGTPVMTFSAVGENASIWGVKYMSE